MDQRKVIICTAVQIETAAVHKALHGVPEHLFELYTVGIRAMRVPTHHRRDKPLAVIMAGLAGALDPSLKVGDVILEDPQNIVPNKLQLRRGKVHTVDQIVATPAQKAELFGRTQAHAVDMENDSIRLWSQRLGAPFVSLRAIGDKADEVLDPDVVHMIDDVGRPRAMQVATKLLERPALAAYLNQLRKNSKIAVDHLAKATRAVVDSLLIKR
jgi:adenosylhomocysteine nucleosidase